jgi:hypothetical protein
LVDNLPTKISIKKQAAYLTGSFFIGLTAGFILVLVVGYVVDIASYSFLKKMGDKALQDLEKNFVPVDGNAWDYYRLALEKVGSRIPSPGLIRYATIDTSLTETVRREIIANQDIYDLIDKGSAEPRCVIPLEYKKAWKMKYPDYVRMRYLVLQNSARSLSYLLRGDKEAALRSIYSGLSFIRNISSGTPQLFNYSWCIAYIPKQMNVLRRGLRTGAFDPRQLPAISKYLADLEVGFPTYRWVVEGEIDIRTVEFANIPFYIPVEFGAGSTFGKKLIDKIAISIWMRFLLWRYGFSTRLGMIRAIKFWDRIIDELEKQELDFLDKTWPLDKNPIVKVNLGLSRYLHHNPLFTAASPNLSGFFRIKTQMLTRIRLLNLAARLWAYRNDHGQFPASLGEIKDYSAIEPFTGEAWRYQTAGDSAVITSPGFNKVYGDVNDLTLTLKKVIE